MGLQKAHEGVCVDCMLLNKIRTLNCFINFWWSTGSSVALATAAHLAVPGSRSAVEEIFQTVNGDSLHTAFKIISLHTSSSDEAEILLKRA